MTNWDPSQPILEIENLSISFFTRLREIPAVMDFSCTVMPGEAMGLVGESGCGKSTVALAVMRDLGVNGRIVGGTIKFKGRDLTTMSQEGLRKLRGSEIAMIYQEPMASLNPAMKVGAQLAEVPMIHANMSKAEAWALARQLVTDVRLPDPDRILNAYPHQLSGGQQQRIVIAMALMSKPALLILDEPTTALDVTVEAGIVDLVKDLAAKYGTSMLFISHNLGLIMEVCDRITVMYSGEAVETGGGQGRVRQDAPPLYAGAVPLDPVARRRQDHASAAADPRQFSAAARTPQGLQFRPALRLFPGGPVQCGRHPHGPGAGRYPPRQPLPAVWRDRLERADAGHVPARNSNPIGEVVLRMDDVRKYYEVAASSLFSGGDTKVVKANETLSFEAREGETLAIVGESGCGKSTFAKVLMGLETATAGQIMLFDENVQSTPIQMRNTDTVSSLQMVFQNPFDTLNPSMTVGRQIIRALEIFHYGSSDADRHQRMLELLDLVKLPRAFAERMPRQLSGGQKQRVGIARAFAGNAKVVIADEPVSALDVSVQAAVTELLMDIQRKNKARRCCSSATTCRSCAISATGCW